MLCRHKKGYCFVYLYTRAASPVHSLESSGFFIVFHTCVLVLPVPYMAPKIFQARSFIAITLGLYYPKFILNYLWRFQCLHFISKSNSYTYIHLTLKRQSYLNCLWSEQIWVFTTYWRHTDIYTVLRYILIYKEHTVYCQLSYLLDTLTLCKISKSFFFRYLFGYPLSSSKF